MTSAPPIIITQPDLQRLERLLDGLADYGPAAEALEEELSRAQVVERSELPAGVVSMNSRVHCRDEGVGKDYHLTLVFPAHRQPLLHVTGDTGALPHRSFFVDVRRSAATVSGGRGWRRK